MIVFVYFHHLQTEMEAIALSCLGHVYDKVLKMKVKAKENFMRSIQLAESLHPKTFNLQGQLLTFIYKKQLWAG